MCQDESEWVRMYCTVGCDSQDVSGVSGFVRMCQDVSECVRVCQGVSGWCVGICQDVSGCKYLFIRMCNDVK